MSINIRNPSTDGPALGAALRAGMGIGLANTSNGADHMLVRTASGEIEKTNLHFVTPEMEGAGGKGTTDDFEAIMFAVEKAKALGVPLIGRGTYFISEPLVFDRNVDPESWDGTNNFRGNRFEFNQLLTSSVSWGVKVIGDFVGDFFRFGSIIGPGTGAIGTVGGTNERIGVLIEGQTDIVVGSISDFNFNMVVQDCYSSDIVLHSSFACIKAFYNRLHPVLGVGSQSNRIKLQSVGGVYTNELLANDTLRRSRSADIGVHLEAMSGSFIDLGASQYCQLTSTSRALQVDEKCNGNEIRVYVEGARDNGDLIYSEGNNNKFYLDGMDSPSIIKSGAITIKGAGNEIFGLKSRMGAAARSVFAPSSGGASVVNIGPSNTVHGNYKVQDAPAASTLPHDLVLWSLSFTISGAGSVTTVSDAPGIFDATASGQPVSSFEVTCNSSDVVWLTSNAITVTGFTAARDILKVLTAIKGVTNHAKVAIFVLNNSGSTLIGLGNVTALTSTTDWQLMELMEKIPAGVSNIKIRFAIRNPVSTETGCVVRIARPMATFNIEAPLRRTREILAHTDVVPGKIMTEEVRACRPIKYDIAIITDLATNALNTDGRPGANITAHPSSNFVNGITNMRDNTTCMIINSSGTSVTFTTSAGAWTSNIVLADGEAMTVLKTANDYFRVG